MPNIGLVELLMITIILLVPGLLLFTLWKRSRHTPLESWAEAHRVQLTERTREVVSAHLARNLRWRMYGALLGTALPLGTKVPGLEMIAGYLLGAILAEISARPAFDKTAPATAVVPRDVQTYIPRKALLLFRALCGTALLTTASFLVVPLRDTEESMEPLFIFVSAGTLLLLGVVESALRFIASRRQSGATEDVIAADDALRAAAMHATLGAGLGLAFLMFGAAALGLSISADLQLLRWAGAPISIVCFLCGVVSWLRLGPDTPWSVRRLDDHRVHA